MEQVDNVDPSPSSLDACKACKKTPCVLEASGTVMVPPPGLTSLVLLERHTLALELTAAFVAGASVAIALLRALM